jgi:hypothetical protein
MSTEAKGEGGGLTGELAEELGGRPWWRHHWCSHGCGGESTIQWATVTVEQHRAHGQTAKHSTTPGDDAGGYRHAVQPARRRRYHHRHREGGGAEAPPRPSQSRSSLEGRSTGRRTAAKSTNPRGQMEALDEAEQCPIWRRRSPPELAGIERRGRRRFGIAREERGLGLVIRLQRIYNF